MENGTGTKPGLFDDDTTTAPFQNSSTGSSNRNPLFDA